MRLAELDVNDPPFAVVSLSCPRDFITSLDTTQGWLDIQYIADIYPKFSFDNIGYFRYFRYFQFLWSLKNIFNVTHCDYVLIFNLCVLLAYDLGPQHFLSVSVSLHWFARLHSNEV